MSKFKPRASVIASPPTPPPAPVASLPGLPFSPAPYPRLITLANPVHKIGFFLTILYVALLSGYLNELLTAATGVTLPAALILGSLAMLAALLSGRLRPALRNRTGYFLIALVGFYTLSIPFSEVKSRSLHLLLTVISANYGVFLMLAALAITLTHCRRLLYTIALAGTVDLAATLKYGTITDGRLAFSAGSLANANDLAAHLLSILPFCLFIAFEKGRVLVIRLLMLAVCGGVLYAALLTGSRSAILSIVVIALFALWKASAGQRALLILLLLGAAPLAPVLAPEAWQRALTIFSNRSAYFSEEALSAVQSKEQRMHLLFRSIEVTMEHPLLGAGPGEFMDVEARLAEEEGMRASWQVTHNTYTQVSSEAGIPALLCFLGVLFSAVSLNLQLYGRARKKPELQNIALMAFCLLMSMVSILVSMTFASWAYTYYMPLSAGLTIALWNASQEELRAAGA
jgi:O-antigen ligase